MRGSINKNIRAGFALTGIMIMVCIAGSRVLAPAGTTDTSISRCTNTEVMIPAKRQKAVYNENKAAQKNTIVMAGSTSMEKFANMAAESFMTQYPEIKVTVEFTGSSAGIESVFAGRADIGNSSRRLKESEKASGAVETIVAVDGIAVITDSGNRVRSLSEEQIADIYTGRIRNWSEVGGTDTAIVVAGREAGSGTRSTFEERLGIKDTCRYANELDSVGAVLARVASTPGAIGYVSFDVLDDTVHAMAVNGIESTEENVRNGSYLLCQPFVMVTSGSISDQSEAVQKFFGYLHSEEGDDLIRKAGLIVP